MTGVESESVEFKDKLDKKCWELLSMRCLRTASFRHLLMVDYDEKEIRVIDYKTEKMKEQAQLDKY